MCYVLLIVVGISSLFMFYNLNESDRRVVEIENETVQLQPLQAGEVATDPEQPVFYVVGDPDRELYGNIYANVLQTLQEMKVPVRQREKLTDRDLKGRNGIFIFCDATVSDYVDQKALEQFVGAGGRIALAAGLAEGYDDSYLTPVLGLVEKTVRLEYQRFQFTDQFFPVQEEYMTYGGYNMSTWITVQDDARVYVTDAEKGTPLVYTHDYGNGRSLVINGTLLDNPKCAGFLTAGLGVLLDDFVYPVVGVEAIYLDNFPLATNADDSTCMKLYGRTTEAFVRDIVWPVLQGISVRNELKYTSSVLAVSSLPDSFPAISESLFSTMGKSALQFDVELAFASYSMDGQMLFAHDEFLSRFESVFENYDVTSLVNTTSRNTDDILEFLDQDIDMVRGNMAAEDPQMRMRSEGDYFVFPAATFGLDLDEEDMLEIASVYASHGMVSHVLDINNFIAMRVDDPVWDTQKLKLADFESRVLRRFPGLEKVTLGQTRNALNSYMHLNYSWKNQGDVLEITADQFAEGQSFMVRVNGKIKDAEGAEYTKISDHYYMLRLNAPRAVLEIARGD